MTSQADKRTDVEIVAVANTKIELSTRGSGRPLLFLHPHIGIDPNAPVLSRLATEFRIIVPSHPGFGRSDLPEFMTTVDDLAYFYLDLLKAMDLRDVVLAGASFGAWLAAEIAIKSTERITHLVLADAVGIKLSDREARDVVDIFTTTQREFDRLAYHRVNPPSLDAKSMSEDELLVVFRNREATARFAWAPYMYDPKLIHRLHLIDVPTLMLWGANDGIASQDYGRGYAERIPQARFEIVADSGHFPHLDQPDIFAQKLVNFVRTARCSAA